MLKLVTEAERKVALTVVRLWILFDTVCIVTDSLCATEPADCRVFVTLRRLVRVDRDFHTEVEQRVRLCKVHYVKLDRRVLSSILHLEEEPLSMTASVDVVLHKQVVLLVVDFLG